MINCNQSTIAMWNCELQNKPFVLSRQHRFRFAVVVWVCCAGVFFLCHLFFVCFLTFIAVLYSPKLTLKIGLMSICQTVGFWQHSDVSCKKNFLKAPCNSALMLQLTPNSLPTCRTHWFLIDLFLILKFTETHWAVRRAILFLVCLVLNGEDCSVWRARLCYRHSIDWAVHRSNWRHRCYYNGCALGLRCC